MTPRPDDLPEGFELDPQLPEGFTLDEEPAGAVLPPSAQYLSRARDPFMRGLAKGAFAMVNPIEWGLAAVGAAKGLYKGMTNPSGLMGDVITSARAMREMAKTPEGAGSLAGELTAGFIPMERLVNAGKAMRFLGVNRESRADNLIQALAADAPATKAKILEVEPEIDLPITTHKGLARALPERVAATGAEVGRTEAKVVGDVDIDKILGELAGAEGGTPLVFQGPMGPVVKTLQRDPQWAAALRKRALELESQATNVSPEMAELLECASARPSPLPCQNGRIRSRSTRAANAWNWFEREKGHGRRFR